MSRRRRSAGGWARALGRRMGRHRRRIVGAACLAVFLSAVLPIGSCRTIDDIPTRVEALGYHDTASPAPSFRNEPDIRVRIKKDASTVTLGSVLTTGGSVVFRPVQGGAPLTLPAPVTVSATRDGFLVSGPGGMRRQFGYGVDLDVLSSSPGAGTAARVGPLRVDGVVHESAVRLLGEWSEGGERFQVIAVMDIETYLPGVLNRELFKDWPVETFRAQAVTARSYALHERHRARAAGRPFDVESDTSDQVYGGATNNPRALNAARDTRGIVLVAGPRDQLLRAYYSSTCGGRPASAADVWPTTRGFEFNLAPALQGRPRPHWCQDSTLYRWTTTRGDEELSRRLRAWGRQAGSPVKGIGRVRSAEVVRRNPADRPGRFRLTDDAGRTYELSAEDLRIACNFPAEGTPEITRQTRVASGDVTLDVWADRVQIAGRGFGHGVGMCQWCAKGMADRGMPYRRMLETFYPGARIKKVY